DGPPACVALRVAADRQADLLTRFAGSRLHARRVELAGLEDEHEAMFARGWCDGLPLVAPTEDRVMRMLQGTTRRPEDVVAVVPPDLVECSVEKVAINAV